jgi:hypothetical protein
LLGQMGIKHIYLIIIFNLNQWKKNQSY